MSWWMRRRGRCSARRQRSASGSVSRKLPPTIQKRSTSPVGRVIDHLRRRPAGRRGTGKPQTSAQRAAVAASTFGTQPTSAPPCTPEWPRIGTRPRFGRPGSPRARPTFTSALIVSTPCACCVRPIDQTKIAFGRSTSSRANASHPLAGRAALALEHVPVATPARDRAPPRSRPCARGRTPRPRRRSRPAPGARRSGTRGRRRCARRTSGRRARVPNTALDAIDGTQ